MRIIFFGLLLALTSTASAQDCYPTNRGMSQMDVANIALLDGAGQRVDVVAFVADTALERASGYQYICPEVVARTTILFEFDHAIATQFHMHNVKAALDIGFFDAAGVLIQSMTMFPYTDGKEILYGPMQKFKYALEARQGFFAEKKFKAGVTRLLLDSLQ